MKPSVYIETTIVSYLTAWPAVDELRRGQQVATEQWWRTRAETFSLCVSQAVIDEASNGDPTAAAARLSILSSIRRLKVGPDTQQLTNALIDGHALPKKAKVDAFHVAVAALNQIDYLLTWNCRHLANAMLRHKIVQVCNYAGLRPLVICTPHELMEQSNG